MGKRFLKTKCIKNFFTGKFEKTLISIPDSRLRTLLSTKSGLGNAITVLIISVNSPVHIKSWNRRKPFRKLIPKVTLIIIAAKKTDDPIVVIKIIRNVSQWFPKDCR
jgi:hypothetical protein